MGLAGKGVVMPERPPQQSPSAHARRYPKRFGFRTATLTPAGIDSMSLNPDAGDRGR